MTNSSNESTATVAKERAGQLGQSAKEATTQVASTAADQAKNVASETRRQTQDLISTAGTQVHEQASAQKEKASGGLRTLAEELRSIAEGNGSQNSTVTDLAQQAADKAQEFAGWLDQRNPGDLVEEIRDLARRKPGTFLIGAALAGVLAGRMTRGVISAQSDDNEAASDNWTTATGAYGEPAFADGSGGFGPTEEVFPSESPSVTLQGDSVLVAHEHAQAGSDYSSGSGYGEGSR